MLAPLLPEQKANVLSADTDRVSMPAPDGSKTLVAALARLDARNIELADIALRRPSLDEVFFALTGDTATREDEEALT